MVIGRLGIEPETDDKGDRVGETLERELPPERLTVQFPAWQILHQLTHLFGSLFLP